MTAGVPELPEGQQLTPGRRWWRRLTFLPLLLLATASIVALALGVVTGARETRADADPASITRANDDGDDPLTSLCQPPVDEAEGTPWWGDATEAEAVWAEHADEIAQPYIIGPDGWIFWSDQVDQYASQAVGRTYLSESDVQQWVTHLTTLRDGLAAAGVEFYFVVTPSTSSVYPEELPEWMQQVRGPTGLDQFVAATGDLPVIDLRQRLIAQKDPDVHLFSWSNSHWTDYGAWASWAQISDCVNALYPEGGRLRVPAVSGAQVVGDFNEWASYGVESPGADWAVPVYAEPLQDVTRTGADGAVETVPGTTVTDASTLPVETTVPDPWTGKSALIFRDSMGGGLSPLWQQAYSPERQIWHRHRAGFEDPRTYADYVAEYQPDVVIVQVAERHLINTPTGETGY